MLNQSCRRVRTSGRSCSLACEVFFPRDPASVQEPPERSDGDAMTLRSHLGLHLDERNVASLCDDRENDIVDSLDAMRKSIATLRLGAGCAGVASPRAPTKGTGDADTEALRRHLARHARTDSRDHTLTKIERKRLRHRSWPPRTSLNVESAKT